MDLERIDDELEYNGLIKTKTIGKWIDVEDIIY